MKMGLIKGDCLEKMKNIKNESIDMVFIDPPYKVISGGNKKGLSYKHKGSITEKNDGKIFEHNNIKICDWMKEIYRVLKNDTHCYVMTNALNMYEMMTEAKKVGFKLHNILVWEKQNCPPNRWYMKNAEYTLFFRKGKAKAINSMGSKTIHKFINPQGNKLHPTEKPIDLIKFYIENSSNTNDTVLDCFMGSGSTAIACLSTGRNFIGVEHDDTYFGTCKDRVNTYIKDNNLKDIELNIS